MSKRHNILILGHGAMGSMFESLLGEHDIAIWERDPDTGEENEPLESICRDRDVVLFALPAHPHHEIARRMSDHLSGDTVCLSIAKGVDEQARTPAQVFERVFADRIHWGMIYGPMIARDLQQGRAGFAVVVSRSERAREAASLFTDTRLYLDTDDDVHGATWAVILKNVFVPLIGAADALELGDNMRGFLLAEAIAELSGIIEAKGGRGRTAFGPAGLGDLLTSATSASSHHRTIGAELACGNEDAIADEDGYIRSEGVHTVEQVREHDVVPRGRYPLFDLAGDFLTGAHDLEEALSGYLRKRFSRRHRP